LGQKYCQKLAEQKLVVVLHFLGGGSVVPVEQPGINIAAAIKASKSNNADSFFINFLLDYYSWHCHS
jgi:hypothetical protein